MITSDFLLFSSCLIQKLIYLIMLVSVYYELGSFNPFTTPDCHISGLKIGRTRLLTV